ncbi:MAG: SDR family NAD(P)-dependent oxidoreductase [Ferruginibacter sp.]
MNKVIIIGATSGIGRALAVLYAKNNWLVGATGRRSDMLESLQQEFPANIITECFDVTEQQNVDHLLRLIGKLDGLDLLIYNSGYGEPSASLDWEIDKNTTAVNVNGFVAIVNYTFNYFIAKGAGHIAATSSIAGNRGNSFAPAYSASKAFMSIYMEGLYLKAKRLKVPMVITDIQPGFVDTKMAKGEVRFWVAPVSKAATQIYTAIINKKRRAYVTKRWWIIAKLMKALPMFLYKKIG